MNKNQVVKLIVSAIRPAVEAAVNAYLSNAQSNAPNITRTSAKATTLAPKMSRTTASSKAASLPKGSKTVKVGKAKAPAQSSVRAPGQKRSPVELESLRTKIVAVVKANPGIISEQIASALGVHPKAIGGQLKSLRVAKTLRTEGTKRYTRHFVA